MREITLKRKDITVSLVSAETRLRPILLRSANIDALSFVWTRVEERRGTTAGVECRYYTNTTLCVVPGLLPKQKNKYLKKVRTSLAPSFAFLDVVVTCAFQCHCSIQTFLSIAKAYMNLFFHVDKNIPFFIKPFLFLRQSYICCAQHFVYHARVPIKIAPARVQCGLDEPAIIGC